ncbi:hypothetical protein [Burkholderia ubonensis]|uniref:hypothetical protein n=1 Tax=Burkholderia ubonensis TaxID=101571 RepID=UPI0015A56AA8|nr:hypothetical protein [Burkholderia ubonensis]
MRPAIPARPEQPQSPLTVGDTVRSIYSGRIGTVTSVYSDNSVSVRWHDKPSDALDLGHERMPRHLLIVIDARAICIDALRRAALAPTYQDALDVAGDALRYIAELARAEVRHA